MCLLTGDVAFLHDVGGLLAAKALPLRATILVVNDDGGGIFSYLPVAAHGDAVEFERLFRTSTGAEVRFFMPVLNVPFRLIYVFNPQRGDCPNGASCVLNDRFRPQEGSLFKFAIGATF